MELKKMTKKIVISVAPKAYTKNRYKKIYGKKLDEENPCTYSEKIFSFILSNRNPIYTKCADKVGVRDYLKSRIEGVEEYFPKHFWTTNNIDSITLDMLPDKFVLKSNHASGHIIICNDKSKFDLANAKEIMRVWLLENHFYCYGERHYKDIKPCVICEELLEDDIVDYRIFCFGGNPYYIRVTKHDKRGRLGYAVGTYDISWNKLDLLTETDDVELEIDKPKHLDEMLELAAKMSQEFDFVRVDLYDTDQKIYFAELTFTPNGGMSKFRNMNWDKKLGDMIPSDLRNGYCLKPSASNKSATKKGVPTQR